MSSGGEEARQQMMNLKRTLQFDEPACLQFTSVRRKFELRKRVVLNLGFVQEENSYRWEKRIENY